MTCLSCLFGWCVRKKKKATPNGSVHDDGSNQIVKISPDQLQLGDTLTGHGTFGDIRKAVACGIVAGQDTTTVTVKMAEDCEKNRTARKGLLCELQVMEHLGIHMNVVNILGAYTQDVNHIILVFEYCAYGNLYDHLLRQRAKYLDNMEVPRATDEPEATSIPGFNTMDLLWYAVQVAQGMEFVASRNVVHGNVAAKSVLLPWTHIAKIADFSLARIVARNGSPKEEPEPVLQRVKWMSLETLSDGEFSQQSDVWSFGVFLWELFSLGSDPYPGIRARDLRHTLESGYRMNRPRYASDNIYLTMCRCWHEEKGLRPTFAELVKTLTSELNVAMLNVLE